MLPPGLVERFCAGDPEAVGPLYDEYGRLVFAVALRVLHQRELAEEATQQTFLQAWRAASTFEPARDLTPWLVTIARRAAIDIQRREQRRSHIGLDEAPPTDTSLVTLPPSAEQIEAVWRVRAAIDGLAPADRDLVRMQHFEGLSHTEIATRLDIPVGTVKSRSFRAHRLLASRLRDLHGAPEESEARQW
jgi:RNA polymerase sigma-70 factor (ECF subfamily)